ncbi:MAG: hypothetical protein AVDCRST_MAG68-5280 [uncultured Gemmatimonadetes bacterium]|uniref:Uncharacterized protein n=1 Tax=uncultured Gemmatimonadota bacterium TaxID=203437 RepID=A0A6J4MX18_9BACT|nr:MAG: hypothetical protein AVDCRST_MAG68-5280 [uncultured Gemmatimonadota bacterium]
MPIDRGAIDAQLRDIGEGDRWWEYREFRDLPHILHVDEQIKGLITGKLLGARGPRIRMAGAWVFVATTHRLIALKQERFARKQVEIAAGQIIRIQPSTRLRSSQIVVETPQRRYRLRVPKSEAFRFAGALATLMPAAPAQPPALETESWSWFPRSVAALPGVAGLVERVSPRSGPDYPSREHFERLELTVEALQNEMERLRNQVSFLEDLLRKQSEDTFLTRSSVDS